MIGIVMERAIEHSPRMKEDFARDRHLDEATRTKTIAGSTDA